MMIEIVNISQEFQGVKVIKSVNLKLDKEQTHVLLGPSGCGKTTLLRLICGLIPSSFGEIRVFGKNVSLLAPQERAMTFGYVVQDGGLFPHLDARDNMILGAQCLGKDKNWSSRRVKEVCDIVGIERTILEKYPYQLSGGQKQKVALGRSLILNPPILLFDEPMSSLDPITRSDTQKELRDLFNHLKKTVVIVTHDLYEASFFGETVTLFNEGSILQHGSFRELLARPSGEFVKKFISAQTLSED